MTAPLRILQFGLGPIGSAIARAVAGREGLLLVAAVDCDPNKIGHDVGEVIGLGRPLGFVAASSLAEAIAAGAADLAIHATNSHFDEFHGQITDLLAAGLDVASTAEELFFPWLDHRDVALEIDQAARQAGRTVLAAGVNPGYLMDALPLQLSALSLRVDHLDITRRINASARRQPFQGKIGAGLSPREFDERLASGRLGHVGLRESTAMIFHALGRELARFEMAAEPILAESPTRTAYFDVPAGGVVGLRQSAHGFSPTGELTRLEFVAALDLADERDTIRIAGEPDLEMTLRGTNGDLCTVAMLVNLVPRVAAAPPGLLTLPELPLVHYR